MRERAAKGNLGVAFEAIQHERPVRNLLVAFRYERANVINERHNSLPMGTG